MAEPGSVGGLAIHLKVQQSGLKKAQFWSHQALACGSVGMYYSVAQVGRSGGCESMGQTLTLNPGSMQQQAMLPKYGCTEAGAMGLGWPRSPCPVYGKSW